MNKYVCNVSLITDFGPTVVDFTVYGRNIKEARFLLNKGIEYGYRNMIAYNGLKLKHKNVDTFGRDFVQDQLDVLEMWKKKIKVCIEK